VVDMERMFSGCTALASVMEFDMRNVSNRSLMFEECGPGARVIDVGMAAQRVALESLDLRSGDEEEVEDDDPAMCGICGRRKALILINHKGPVGEEGPHRSCGKCIHEWITTKWADGQEAKCPFCRAEFKLSELQKNRVREVREEGVRAQAAGGRLPETSPRGAVVAPRKNRRFFYICIGCLHSGHCTN
jgi:hypothetical protein